MESTVGQEDDGEDFELERELGHGAYAVVYECHRKGLEHGAPVAVKVVSLETIRASPHYTTQENQIKRLKRLKELNDLSRTGRIIRFLDFRLSSSDLFLFFTFCKGGDLFNRILESPEGRFTEEQAKRATYNLVICIAELHPGVIHRDIKPENIMYHNSDDGPEEIVLADFGLCEYDVQEGQTFTETCGTPGYMAPEVLLGIPYNHKVDIFSAGITAYEMLSGRSPWVSDNPVDLAQEVVNRPVPFPRTYWADRISKEGMDCVKRMVEKDPRRRWTAAQLLKHPWLHDLQEEARHKQVEHYGATLAEEPPDDWQDRSYDRSPFGSDHTDYSDETRAPSSQQTTHLAAKAASLRKVKDPDALAGVFDTKLVLEGKLPQHVASRFGEIES